MGVVRYTPLAGLVAGMLHCGGQPLPPPPVVVGPATAPAPSGPPSPTALVAGGDTSCALLDDASLWCWGDVYDGVVSHPVRIDVPPVRRAAVGTTLGCAITQEGETWCWGRPQRHSPRLRPEPARVGSLPPAKAVAVMQDRVCVVDTEKRVHCWLDDEPPVLMDHVGPATDLVADLDLMCALTRRQPTCWTREGLVRYRDRAIPRALSGSPPLTKLAVDGLGVCGLTEDHRLFCWGRRCGKGRVWDRDRDAPCDLSEGATPAFAIDGYGRQLCVARRDATSCRGAPQGVEPPRVNETVAVSYWHACGIGASGVACWGDRQLGRVGAAAPWTPERYRIPLTGRLALSKYLACWLSEGEVRCFSSSPYLSGTRPLRGETLNGTDGATHLVVRSGDLCVTLDGGTSRCTRVDDDTADGFEDAVALGMGGNTRCALRADGRVFCRSGGSDPSPVAFAETPLTGVTDLVVQKWHACFVSAGEVYCRRHAPSTEPLHRVDGLAGATDVAATESSTCALREGRVYCWGEGGHGELGLGFVHHEAPHPVAGLPPISTLAGGANHYCAVDTDGHVWCWGDARRGQLGTGTRRSTGRPVKVPGVEGAVDVAAGGDTSCAVRKDDTICWGPLRWVFTEPEPPRPVAPHAVGPFGDPPPDPPIPAPVDVTPVAGRR